jgi:hypothetical protein
MTPSASLTKKVGSMSSDVQPSAFSDISTFLETRLDYFQATTTPTARTAAFSTSEKEVDTARQLTRFLLFASQHPHADLRFAARAPLAYLSLPHGDEPPWYGEQKQGWIGVTHV